MSAAVVPEVNVEVNHQTNPDPLPGSTPIVRICLHIKDDGLRCGTPAVTGRQFCYFHCRAHHPGARIAIRRYRVPIPEAVASLQIALAHIMQALATGDISPKEANSMMFGINLGTNLLRLAKPLTDTEKQQVATEIPEPMQQVLDAPEEPRNTETIEPNAPPDVPQQAILVVEREIRNLRSKCLTPEQLRTHEQHARTLKGTADPRYYVAIERISHHDYATKRLHEMGLATNNSGVTEATPFSLTD